MDSQRFSFLNYFCAAMVLCIRAELLENDDFAYSVKALQRYEGRVPIEKVMKRACELFAQDLPAATRR